MVLGREDDIAVKSFRNLPRGAHPGGRELNTYDVLVSDWVVFTSQTVPARAWLLPHRRRRGADPEPDEAAAEPEEPAADSEEDDA